LLEVETNEHEVCTLPIRTFLTLFSSFLSHESGKIVQLPNHHDALGCIFAEFSHRYDIEVVPYIPNIRSFFGKTAIMAVFSPLHYPGIPMNHLNSLLGWHRKAY
jgi:hypothetical protein